MEIELPNKAKLVLSSFGATIVSLELPDREGEIKDVVLGFDTVQEYDRDRDSNPCFGSVIGRVANRIANSKFTLNQQTFNLDVNCGEHHHLHGGLVGFHLKNWKTEVIAPGKVQFILLSEDGD